MLALKDAVKFEYSHHLLDVEVGLSDLLVEDSYQEFIFVFEARILNLLVDRRSEKRDVRINAGFFVKSLQLLGVAGYRCGKHSSRSDTIDLVRHLHDLRVFPDMFVVLVVCLVCEQRLEDTHVLCRELLPSEESLLDV